ncbi:hypothetical protein [Haliea sp. E17]|uniref:hypothetical protein n=1 Tax=Haliea sp. E17 TaxID=3401576 RepID=UPI003AAF43D8
MEKKDTAPARAASQSWQQKFIKFTTARQYRVVIALYQRPHSREEIDRVSGSSNGPEVVRQLREQGWDIPCQLVAHTDRDGLKGKHGVYSLSSNDRLKLRELLAGKGVTHV